MGKATELWAGGDTQGAAEPTEEAVCKDVKSTVSARVQIHSGEDRRLITERRARKWRHDVLHASLATFSKKKKKTTGSH